MQPILRKLTTDQKAVLIQVLVAFPNQQVDASYHPAASDARDYAQDFLTVFKVIGWKVSDGAPSASLNRKSSGVALVVSEGESLSPSAEALRDALRVFGVDVATIADPAYSTPPGGFILSVGARAYTHRTGKRGIKLPHAVAFVRESPSHYFPCSGVQHRQRLLASVQITSYNLHLGLPRFEHCWGEHRTVYSGRSEADVVMTSIRS
jgi:hypothetical protein